MTSHPRVFGDMLDALGPLHDAPQDHPVTPDTQSLARLIRGLAGELPLLDLFLSSGRMPAAFYPALANGFRSVAFLCDALDTTPTDPHTPPPVSHVPGGGGDVTTPRHQRPTG